VNTGTDNENCGACGNICGAGTGCSEGQCVVPVTLLPPGPRCDNGGPPIDVFPGNGGCTGQIAGITFTFALCACTDIGSTKVITTDGFDSTQGPYVPGQDGAGIGVNNSIASNGVITAGGDLWVAGPMDPTGDIAVHQRMLIDGNLFFSKLLTVDEDSFVNGSITKQGGQAQFTTLDVLTTPTCPPDGVGGVEYGSCVPATTPIPAPCDCDPATDEGKIDVRNIVAFHAIAANNNNASIGLLQTALDDPAGRVRLDLPCGKYYFNSINGAHPITVVAHGHVAIFIGGSVSNSQELTFDLDPTATLDIFIGGVMKGSQDLTVGNPLYPRLTRMFIGSQSTSGNGGCSENADCSSGRCVAATCVGSGIGNLTNSFELSGNSFLNGLFYTGFGTIKISAPLEMFGAIFTKKVESSQPMLIHYDRAAIGLAQECGEGPPQACTTCQDCNNQACSVFGTCTQCDDDFDCCQPLRCVSGTCELIP
jgi:hypothetical protein